MLITAYYEHIFMCKYAKMKVTTADAIVYFRKSNFALCMHNYSFVLVGIYANPGMFNDIHG